MSKGSRHRATQKRRRAKRSTRPGQSTSAEPDLIADIRTAIADPNPLSLLSYVSMLLGITDPRQKDPFTRDDSADRGTMTREELVQTFLDVPIPETSALLAVITEMVGGDDVLRARIRRELATRPKVEPIWVARLSEVSTYRAVLMSHVLGDGDDIMLGAKLPGGHEITCVIYIDHNLGTLVKDAFVISAPIVTVVATSKRAADDPDTSWDDMRLADARAWVEAAIQTAAITYPPLETESWPACRALVEWVIGRLPDGGTGYQRPQYGSAKVRRLTERFFASAHGAGLDDPDHRGLLDSLLWFGTDYGPGDPLRWSPVKIEILLDDWIPRKIVAPASYLAEAPALLRAFIRFAHEGVGIRSDLTEQALAAVDSWEPVYQETIRTPRLQGPSAVLAALGFAARESENFEGSLLDQLALEVGDQEQLDRLDDNPLPDEPFRWEDIDEDVTTRVDEVVSLTDECCQQLLDTEYRTACRRLLARIASEGPEFFRGNGRAETAAAASVWIIGKANDLFDQWSGMQVKDLMSHFGLRQGGVSQRAASMLRAGGFPCETYDVRLASPDYLVAARRRRIIELRERYRQPVP